MTASTQPPTPTEPPTPTRATSFNAAAAQYAKNRPSYPPTLLDAIEHLAAHPLTGSRVADIGAGTGISTALLHARGAHVIAVEPGDGMAAQFRRTLPDVPIVRGNGNALPLADASVDFLTYAQSWHWTDPDQAIPEALRVLRPGGALALWWNTYALDVPWITAQANRIRYFFGVDPIVENNGASQRAADPSGRLDFASRQLRWSRRVPIDTHLANIGSHSLFLVHDKAETEAFLAEERNLLLKLFPSETVEETYEVDLLVATTALTAEPVTTPTT
ncbi:class I SAM-dependent methyltransferase [Streptomyces sp. ME02-8801-2C]|uniref:class I SAM-dependent methyltransferase n=1 Tax=Streptomyces sp. ME02-8801-2C TaxID=3028680 RepID=UPI0029A4E8E3|nr:class I SAM-dependent methyltransferase [Streptomyces sp. ME02-8801-2C]MDX3456331.1 class I SAM-dependent methyltransferase [Streptomyces sp. ME02-8801-2C]